MALREYQVHPTFRFHVNPDDIERLCVLHDVESFEDVIRVIVADALESGVRDQVDFNEADMSWTGLDEILVDEME